MEYDSKGMPFRRLGPSGLRVPVFFPWRMACSGRNGERRPCQGNHQTLFLESKQEPERHWAFAQAHHRRNTTLFEASSNGLCRRDIYASSRQNSCVSYHDMIIPIPKLFMGIYLVGMEEIMRAFNYVTEKGWAFYWAMSEWSARDIEETYHVADELNLIPPIAERCQHHMSHRQRLVGEYAPIYAKYGISTTVWSALAKSRFDNHKNFFKDTIGAFSKEEGKRKFVKIDQLSELAQKELGCKPNQLALAWVAKQPRFSTVILGASRPEQVVDNLKALEVIPKLTPEIMDKIEKIIENKPAPEMTTARPPLDSTYINLYEREAEQTAELPVLLKSVVNMAAKTIQDI
ncbi:hypothetical protein ACEPAF_4195 [Sanghuangporus sanghuang]